MGLTESPRIFAMAAGRGEDKVWMKVEENIKTPFSLSYAVGDFWVVKRFFTTCIEK